MSDRGHFFNIDTLNRILFSQLTRFGKLSFFNFRPSFLSPDTFRSIGCIGCKLIFLADVAGVEPNDVQVTEPESVERLWRNLQSDSGLLETKDHSQKGGDLYEY